jgi:HSP20 family molecular chaperone IbpA
MAQIFQSKTDKGLVIDVVAPGYGAADVKVQTFQEKAGDDAVDAIRIVGKYTRRATTDGKNVPRFAYEKYVEEKFVEKHYLDQKYDKAKLAWDVKNGVIRIRVGLQAWAVGQDVTAVANVDATADAE